MSGLFSGGLFSYLWNQGCIGEAEHPYRPRSQFFLAELGTHERETHMSERQYVLTKIDKGDYLLPSNDGKILWRLNRYWEDGSLSYIDGNGAWHDVHGWGWQTLYYMGPWGGQVDRLPDDFLEWEHWSTWAAGFATRGEAIDEAMCSWPT